MQGDQVRVNDGVPMGNLAVRLQMYCTLTCISYLLRIRMLPTALDLNLW